MRITDIEPVVVHVNHRGDWVFVLVHTDAGITGLGEAAGRLSTKPGVGDVEELDLAYAPPISPVYDPVLIAATVAKKELAKAARA